MSWLEVIATVLGVLGVGLMIRRNLWAFPVGITQVVIFGWVCFAQKLFSETALQLMFLAALAHGWWHWTHAGPGKAALPVQRLSMRMRLAWVLAALALWVAWGSVMQRAGAALPWGDAFVFAVSVCAQWLQARKCIENWGGWLVANTVAIGVFVAKELYLFAGLYGLFWGMAVKRIAVFGPESTGKTELARKLAAHFRAPLVEEYARERWDAQGALGLEDMLPVAKEQWRREDEALLRQVFGGQAAPKLIICDTEALTTMLWSDLLYGTCPDELRRNAEKRCRNYALYLLCDIDVPFAPDPQRCFPDPEDREKARRIWYGALERRGLPFVWIRGDWAARERAAVAAVEKLMR
jgi:nicotinamide mononucleotide transporter PnuC